MMDELLRHLLSNDHGEWALVAQWFMEYGAWARAQLRALIH